MARRLGRDSWQGPESPQMVMKAVLTQGAAETGRASAGGAATGQKFIEFQFIETGEDFFALHMEEELALKKVERKVTGMIKGMEEL